MPNVLHLFGELAFISGIIFNFWAFLSPTPWHSNDVTNSMLYFVPYVEPVGYVAPNPCGSSPLSNATVSITYGGSTTSSSNYSNVAVWMGPLGSCSRDEDGATHCTKASFKNPQFNMTYVQDNSVFYPQNMPGNMSGSRIRGFTILHCVEFFLWLLVMIPFWFPRFASRGFKVAEASAPAGFMGMLIVILGLAATVEFFMNFAIRVDNISLFNSIDNFYQPAQCGTTRPLKTGILLVARAGKMYNMMWVAWVMIYCVAGPVIIGRCIWIADNFEKSIRAADEKRAARDVERQAKQEEKDQKKFRAEVDKEKERIRSVALQELKAEESNKVEPSPPYLEVNIEKEK